MKIDNSWYIKPPGVSEHVSCGGVVVRKDGDLIVVALVREGNYPLFVLPKGHLEQGEDPEQAARREIAEESGITDLKLLEKMRTKERLDIGKRSWKTTHYFLFHTGQVEAIPGDPHHPQQTEWFPLDAMPEMFWPEQRALIEDNRERIKMLLINIT